MDTTASTGKSEQGQTPLYGGPRREAPGIPNQMGLLVVISIAASIQAQ
ncbi:hypothetical protein GJA_3714 [Janthinobacterium agaricidamnosum NBRC 102515 = DSM 9628]|uniref:Uncharacterized protein n=1 Tax=Janthinobacterium agaricidamnosum NBRC 102515 = DSM 9628 TaxID=1349767 RepID=W0V674_9BURK|nr:hypothetical protein GJA_3714 [Janthinobacterium agaricidamnosum NBRC 102515 = DSM 9628]